ncbi:MAG: site-specific DNA-methyltransferase [Geopsychrobacter sp.]|nr:site-specific DNA-methyltransferase [Geopsychrobacter sp.]
MKRAIDFDQLRQELSDNIVEGPRERYRLDWPGKREALLTANAPIAKTLRPCKEESVDFDTTQNLYIEGDNLDALKLLQETYLNKVKMIYIDPPYNTGNEGWCYNDNVRSPLMKEWLKKAANPVDKEDLERHDKWLCMMWPRLNLLYELLSETGVMVISIDDNEFSKLILLLDEFFCPEENQIKICCWKTRNTDNRVKSKLSVDHEYVIFISKSALSLSGRVIDRSDFSNPDKDVRGDYVTDPLTGKATASQRPNLHYPIVNHITGDIYGPDPARGWITDESGFKALLDENRIYWPENPKTGKPRKKRFLDETAERMPISSFWAGLKGQSGADEVDKILGERLFDFPKSIEFLNRIVDLISKPDSIILDSFAGSGTTAHAVLKANEKDNSNRRFILIECEEYADTLTAERVRRVIKGYPFKGTQREELYSKKITWSNFSKSTQMILREVEHIEQTKGAEFDKVKKELKDGVLTVTGERKIEEKAPGLGGSFTYCTLGEPIEIESLLTGKGLPSFEALARYVFYTATGQSLDKVAKPAADGFVGETDLFRIHLFYQPDAVWLRSNDSALNAERVEVIGKNNTTGKRSIVFAVAKFMSQKELTQKRLEFCQLPYAVHRILGG